LGRRPSSAIELTLLPEPDSPTMASTSPVATLYETFLAAGTQTPSTPKSTERSLTSRTTSPGVKLCVVAFMMRILPGSRWRRGDPVRSPTRMGG
jgi:hypothetical protein